MNMAKKIIPTPEETVPSGLQPGRIDEQISKPGTYEITDNEEFKIELHMRQKDGRWVTCEEKLGEKTHQVVFRMWSYEEEIELRKRATQYDSVKHWHFIDHDILNRLKIQRLMKSWSLEQDNARLKLLHVNGVMADESFNAVMKLHPNILRKIIEGMNEVLELNG
jgi:hypothetical protein